MSTPTAKRAMSNSLSSTAPPPAQQQQQKPAINPYINNISFGAGAASAMYGSVSGSKKAKADEVRSPSSPFFDAGLNE
jgi:hypothetical protein